MKREALKKIEEKASKKTKDGIYSYKGDPYGVINQRLVLIGDYNQILQVSHGFLVVICECERHQLKTKFKEAFKLLIAGK